MLLGDCKASIWGEDNRFQLREVLQGLGQIKPLRWSIAKSPPSNPKLLHCIRSPSLKGRHDMVRTACTWGLERGEHYMEM